MHQGFTLIAMQAQQPCSSRKSPAGAWLRFVWFLTHLIGSLFINTSICLTTRSSFAA